MLKSNMFNIQGIYLSRKQEVSQIWAKFIRIIHDKKKDLVKDESQELIKSKIQSSTFVITAHGEAFSEIWIVSTRILIDWIRSLST